MLFVDHQTRFGVPYHTMPDWTPCRRKFHLENSCRISQIADFWGFQSATPQLCILVATRLSFCELGDSSYKRSRATAIGKASKMNRYTCFLLIKRVEFPFSYGFSSKNHGNLRVPPPMSPRKEIRPC